MTRVTTLQNGLKIVVERLGGVRSAGISWLVPAGRTSEPAELAGLTSIAEELLQRGSGDRDSRAVADAFDRAGASRSIDIGDRYTTMSCTTLGSRTDEALELVADMVLSPRFEDASLEPSRELALAALASLQDEPRDRAADSARQAHYPDPYNRSRYGTKAGLESVSLEAVRNWWSARCCPTGSILSVAGDVDPDKIIAQIESLTSSWTGSAEVAHAGEAQAGGMHHIEDESNQVQIFLLHEAPPAGDEAAALRERILVHALSGGMSGRLFTEVREKRGLCYAVSASYRSDAAFGAVQAYVGTTPERAQESLDVLWSELERVGTPEGTIGADEFQRAVVGMKSNVVFHSESTSARAMGMASDWDRLGRVRTLDEITADIDRVTLGDVQEHAGARSLGRVTVQTLGPEALRAPAGCAI